LTRKLVLLNLVLLLGVTAAGWRFRQDWLAARAREQRLFGRHVKPPAPPPVIFSRPVEPVMAASYADIALKMLFSKDRNPNVVVEVKPEPPPKPMPPLPVLYGVMNLPGGATAVMSEKANTRHLGIRPGEKVGEFTLLAVNRDDITLEWDGKQLVKKINDLIDRSGPPQAPAEGNTPRAAAPTGQSSTQLSPQPAAKAEPGKEMNSRMRACQPGDNSPAGTVSGGFKKLITATPFGDQCRWEPL